MIFPFAAIAPQPNKSIPEKIREYAHAAARSEERKADDKIEIEINIIVNGENVNTSFSNMRKRYLDKIHDDVKVKVMKSVGTLQEE